MKLIFFGILTLAIYIAFLPYNALAAPGDAVLLPLESSDPEAYVEQSIAVVNNTLYILRPDEGLYSYHVGDEAPVKLMDLTMYNAAGTVKTEAEDFRLQYIVNGGEKLYALNNTYEQLWSFNEAKGVFEPELDLDTSTIKSGPEYQQWVNAFNYKIIDGFLYMLVLDSDTYTLALKKFSLSTGAITDIKIDKINDYAHYKDGKLLVGLGEWMTKEIGIFDLETGEYEKKMDISVYGYFGLQYDSEIDAHYMWIAGEILRSVAFGDWETVAYIPVNKYSSLPCALLPGGYFTVCLPDSVHVRNIDPQYLPKQPLKLNGILWEKLTHMFAKANPDVPIAYSNEFFQNVKDMADHMTSHDAADVYLVYSVLIDLYDLNKKGYLADLSGNQAITEIVNKMYPNIREALTFNKKIEAIPYVMDVNSFGVNLKTLEAIGLTLDDAPKTYYALLEFIERWINEYSVDYPDIKLFEHNEDLDNQLMNAIINAQIACCDTQGVPLTFNTPAMRKLLAKLESIDFTPLNENISFEGNTNYNQPLVIAGSNDSAPLFIINSPITAELYFNNTKWEFEPTPLALDEGMPAVLAAQVSWLVLNQKSAGNEEAMRFMQYYAENMYPATRINTMPGENEPIDNPNYVRDLEYFQETLSMLEVLLEDERTDKPYTESVIQEYQEKLEAKEKWRWRWMASPEYIARYRSLYDHISIVKPNFLFNRYYVDISTLISKYIKKEINGDQFIIELSQKLPMMQMEEYFLIYE